MTPEELFLSNLQLIERIIASLCRRHCFFGDEAEDFSAWVKFKLIDDDYAVLRKFQGKSLLKTYLNTVVANLFRDQMIQKYGKWHSSMRARNLGGEAVQLEYLLYREGHALHDAVEILATSSKVELSRDELTELAAQLPVRPPRRFEGDQKLQNLAADGRVEERILDQERIATARRVEAALRDALGRLPHEDRLILRMWLDGFSIAVIAKRLGIKQRSLYSRRDKALRKLAASLEDEGLGASVVRDLLDWKGLNLKLGFLAENENASDASEGRDGDGGRIVDNAG